jgi:hypothetical protein
MVRYPCTNPACTNSWHNVPGCPYRYVSSIPRGRPYEAAVRRLRELSEAGAFDRPAREPAQPGPGHGWLLVFVPIAVLLLLAMVLLVVR